MSPPSSCFPVWGPEGSPTMDPFRVLLLDHQPLGVPTVNDEEGYERVGTKHSDPCLVTRCSGRSGRGWVGRGKWGPVVRSRRPPDQSGECNIRRKSGGNSRYKRGSQTAGNSERGNWTITNMTRRYVRHTKAFRRSLSKTVVPASKGRNSMSAGLLLSGNVGWFWSRAENPRRHGGGRDQVSEVPGTPM